MKKLHFLFRLTIFWVIYFALFRLAFMLYYKDQLPAGQLGDTLHAFVIGLHMDIATICYLLIIPFVLYMLTFFVEGKLLARIIHMYHLLILITFSLLHILNIYLYEHWGTLIDGRIFMYAKYLHEDLSYINNTELITIIVFWLASSSLFYFLYKKLAGNYFPKTKTAAPVLLKASSNLLFVPLIIIGLRGGLQFTPMNESIIFYSSYPINDWIASNIPWHVGFSLLEESDSKNPFVVMPDKEAKQIVHKMLAVHGDSTTSILTTKRPNVVIIMLESWTAGVIKELGGDTATTPCFDTLRKHGLLFTQAYASGSRTDQGLASIVSGFPSQPGRSIINMPEKSAKLPFITNAFVKHGYHLSYYHGGDADFANMKMYLVDAHFNKIVDKHSFPSIAYNGRLGINDEYVFSRHIQDMSTEQQPFFSLIMTLSSHEPFEVPCHHVFEGKNTVYERLRNAVYYSDSCLAKYLAEASKQKWYDSTIFILVSDHGNVLPKLYNAYTPDAHHIVIMFYGGALKPEYRGKEMGETTDQCDITAMLYSQLGFDHSEFPWSKDDLNPTVKHFANYANDVEAGIVSGSQHLTYSFNPRKIRDFFIGKVPADSLYKCGEAWLQLYYQQYLDY